MAQGLLYRVRHDHVDVKLYLGRNTEHDDSKELPVMAMWKIWNCQTLHKSLEITNALIAVHVKSQTLYTEITNAVHVTSLPGSLYVCLHFATAHILTIARNVIHFSVIIYILLKCSNNMLQTLYITNTIRTLPKVG